MLLAGCTSAPAYLPEPTVAPVEGCQWTAPEAGSLGYLRRVMAALEADDFVIVETEARLGLVTAQRSRVLAGYGAPWHEPMPFGLSGAFGLGAGHHRAGMAINLNRSFGVDPTQIERISVVARDKWVRVSRDLQVVEADGRLRSGRVVPSEAFCRALREALARLPEAPTS
ncbi:hypothetical protein [Halomonas sp. YLGW01]|uniref:hypothetical protein n=1 Tax=Halomonas sp. YLGW01 TaxID=2773308 RepID=UPI0017808C33|nr:hypothetical protein [Halomonas sp. YLGW01]